MLPKVVVCDALETPKVIAHRALSDLIELKMSLTMAEGLG